MAVMGNAVVISFLVVVEIITVLDEMGLARSTMDDERLLCCTKGHCLLDGFINELI